MKNVKTWGLSKCLTKENLDQKKSCRNSPVKIVDRVWTTWNTMLLIITLRWTKYMPDERILIYARSWGKYPSSPVLIQGLKEITGIHTPNWLPPLWASFIKTCTFCLSAALLLWWIFCPSSLLSGSLAGLVWKVCPTVTAVNFRRVFQMPQPSLLFFLREKCL